MDRSVAEALSAARTLRTLAERGRIVLESNSPQVRELLIKGTSRLIYRVDPRHVNILAFVHTARDLAALWSQIEGR